MVSLDNVTVTDNYSSSHSGAFLVWGSQFVVADSRIERVRGARAAMRRGRALCGGAGFNGRVTAAQVTSNARA